MGQGLSSKFEEIYQKKEKRESEKESYKKTQEVKMQAHMEALKQIKDNLSNKPVSELPKKMRFKAAHQVSQYYDQSEKQLYSDLKKEYFQTTYIMTAISVPTAFILPLPFRRFSNLKSYQKFFIWVTIFGLTHKAGMYEINYRVDQFQLKMIEKYKSNLLGFQILGNRTDKSNE